MGDDTPSYILIGLLVLLCGGAFLILFLGRRRRLKGLEANGIQSEARVVSIHRKELTDPHENFPGFELWVRHGSEGNSTMGWLRMNYWTVRTNFPELIEASKRPPREGESLELQFTAIPILVDPENPESFEVDYSRVQRKRGGTARLGEV